MVASSNGLGPPENFPIRKVFSNKKLREILTSSLHGHSSEQEGTAPWKGFEKCVELPGDASEKRIEAKCNITVGCGINLFQL